MMDKDLFDDLLGLDEETKGCVSWLGCTSMMIIVLFVVAMLTCSCSRTQYVRVVETRDSIVERTIVDTVQVPVYIEIPAQTTEIITEADSSHLENDYAISDAKIDSAGRLHHSLKTKPQKLETEVALVTQHTELEVYHEEKESEREDKVVEVNRLYWWQKSLMWGGVVLLVAMTGGLVYLIYKVYKRMKVP